MAKGADRLLATNQAAIMALISQLFNDASVSNTQTLSRLQTLNAAISEDLEVRIDALRLDIRKESGDD
jgi:hypothetical protein